MRAPQRISKPQCDLYKSMGYGSSVLRSRSHAGISRHIDSHMTNPDRVPPGTPAAESGSIGDVSIYQFTDPGVSPKGFTDKSLQNFSEILKRVLLFLVLVVVGYLWMWFVTWLFGTVQLVGDSSLLPQDLVGDAFGLFPPFLSGCVTGSPFDCLGVLFG